MNEVRAPSRRSWIQRISWSVYFHLVLPFLQTHDPLKLVARGATIGMFVGLTPTVGIQMYMVTMIWVFCRYVLRYRFNITIAVAMVWITNPVTTVPFYYAFLKIGLWVQAITGHATLPISFEVFKAEVDRLAAGEAMGMLQYLLFASKVLIVEYGWPMVVGSLTVAVPASVAVYPFTYAALHRYRRLLAESAGLSYEDWRRKFEAKH